MENNELNWKRLGWNFTKKLVYYVLAACSVIAIAIVGFTLMNIPNWMAFVFGLVVVALSLAITIMVLAREVDQLFSKINKQ